MNIDIEVARQELHQEAQIQVSNFRAATSAEEQKQAEQNLLFVIQKAQQLNIEHEFEAYLR